MPESNKTPRACDICKKRKIKCAGGLPCAYCIKANRDCQYSEPKKRGRPTKPAYHDGLYSGSKELDSPSSSDGDRRVIKTPPAMIWTTKDFKQLMIPDLEGNPVYWVDMFFRDLDYDFGIIPKDLFERHMDEFPPFLLHSMLACCYKSSVLPISVFDPHFQSAAKLMNPEKPSLFNCISEITLAMFCYYAGYHSYGIPFFTRAITTSNLIGLSLGYLDSTTSFDNEDHRILAIRTWMSLYSIDYYYRLLWKVPCLMTSEVPQSVMDYLKTYGTKAQLYHEDNMLSFSMYLVPLFHIGKRFYHQLDGNHSDEVMDKVIDELLSEMVRWKATLPPLNPFPESEKVPFVTERYWDTFLLINYHILYLVIMSHRFARLIDKAPMSDPCIYQTQQHADSLTSLFLGCNHNYESFERVAGMLIEYVYISGIIHCALGYRDLELLKKGVLHFKFLQAPGLSKHQMNRLNLFERFPFSHSWQ